MKSRPKILPGAAFFTQRRKQRPDNSAAPSVADSCFQEFYDFIQQEFIRLCDNPVQEEILARRESIKAFENALSGNPAAPASGALPPTPEDFWRFGEIITANGLTLRRRLPADKENFFKLKRCYSSLSSRATDEASLNKLWDVHTRDVVLSFTIEQNGEYLGYCEINDTTQLPWELSIELLPQKTRQGIGAAALRAMLDEIKLRLGITEFRVRIEPNNVASQRLFEKLGAVPNGISVPFPLEPEVIERVEQKNLPFLNDHTLALAQKFGVEPRKLLSHVLEYKLVWKG